jgi:hypothetical protein
MNLEGEDQAPKNMLHINCQTTNNPNNSMLPYALLLIGLLSCNPPVLDKSNAYFESMTDSICNRVDLSIQAAGVLQQPAEGMTYDQAKNKAAKAKARIKQLKLPQDSVAHIFTELLVNELIPHWYGTPWTFEGHTDKPKQGDIACGYFVSTTLLHMGINVNRYKLAQQWPSIEAKSLSLGEPVITITNTTTASNIEALCTQLAEGIYFLGFGSNHVGYLLKRDGALFVIHSKFINNEGVVIEKVCDSAVFAMFQQFHIAPLSTNLRLMERWVSGTAVTVLTE